ncbi:N6-adenosine-methyltransferase subunit METTL3 [Patella vulgata]|uniref:N6-adenosine-methyltransferase subunit METTL3 n=1 Tax=Patella vulgata TaxID=6465 RepID=UPI0024A7F178|nr:N6-adenosine-methyltransferase subunit METTL3 [Patella vulgata]
MSDTWSDILAVKTKQNSLRAKLQQRKKEREGLAKELGVSPSSTSTASSASSSTTSIVDSGLNTPTSKASFDNVTVSASNESAILTKKEIIHPEIEKKLPYVLCDMNLELPAESSVITGLLNKMLGQDVSDFIVKELLEKFSAQQLISILKSGSDKTTFTVTSVDLSKLSALYSDVGGTRKRKRDDDDDIEEEDIGSSKHQKKNESALPDDSIESLLNTQSAKEKENKKVNEEILQILSQPTAKEQYLVEKFKSRGGAQLKEFCQFGTREECKKINNATEPCNKLHFRKIIHKHTDESLGDCSFLNTCFHMETCKYVHYEY